MLLEPDWLQLQSVFQQSQYWSRNYLDTYTKGSVATELEYQFMQVKPYV